MMEMDLPMFELFILPCRLGEGRDIVLGEESVEAVTPFDILGNQDGVF